MNLFIIISCFIIIILITSDNDYLFIKLQQPHY